MSGTAKHALIIEDEMLVGMGMQSMLSDLGFESFAFASTAHQALEQARLKCPDLVTADISLLDGDGIEVCRELETLCGHLAIICVTGQPELAVGSGRAVVSKPFTAADIAEAYARVTGASRAA